MHSDDHRCVVKYAFSEPGCYRIKVYVSNPYYLIPVQGELPYIVYVVETMSDLALEKKLPHSSKSECIQLYKRDSVNYSTEVIILQAR